MQANATASYSGVVAGGDLSAAMQSFRSAVGSNVTISIVISHRGGPAIGYTLPYQDQSTDLSSVITAINNWIKATSTNNSSNATILEYFCRPLTDFIINSGKPDDIQQELSLREWYLLLGSVKNMEWRLNSVIDRTQTPVAFRQQFSYYADSSNGPQYYLDKFTEYEDIESQLWAVVPSIENQTASFDANNYPLPDVVFPVITLSQNGGWPAYNPTGPVLTYDASYYLNSGDFSDTARFGYNMVHSLVNDQLSMAPTGYDSSNNRTSVNFHMVFPNDGYSANQFLGLPVYFGGNVVLQLMDKFYPAHPIVSVDLNCNPR